MLITYQTTFVNTLANTIRGTPTIEEWPGLKDLSSYKVSSISFTPAIARLPYFPSTTSL